MEAMEYCKATATALAEEVKERHRLANQYHALVTIMPKHSLLPKAHCTVKACLRQPLT
jgi:hypothetical protein